MRRALVLTASDGVVAGVREDASGARLAERLAVLGFTVDRAAVPDDRSAIEAALMAASDSHALIITTGGTGLTPRDVTPQATLSVIDYDVPGLAEAMRAAGRSTTPFADLSRGVVGVRGRTLIVNVPGSPSAAAESLAALEPALDHALDTLAGPYDHEARPVGHGGVQD
jgi:molybdenum cofactor synthesis domain-containing protein